MLKKDEIIQELNVQAEQMEQHFKDIIGKKVGIIVALE